MDGSGDCTLTAALIAKKLHLSWPAFTLHNLPFARLLFFTCVLDFVC